MTRALALVVLAGCGLVSQGPFRAGPISDVAPPTRIAVYVLSDGPLRQPGIDVDLLRYLGVDRVDLDTELSPDPKLVDASRALAAAVAAGWSDTYGLQLTPIDAPHAGKLLVEDLVADARDTGYDGALVVGWSALFGFSDVADVRSRSNGWGGTTETITLQRYNEYLGVPAATLFLADGTPVWRFERFGWVETAKLPNLIARRASFETTVLTRTNLSGRDLPEAMARTAALLTDSPVHPDSFLGPLGD